MPHEPLFTDELRAMANATHAHVAYKRYIKRIGDKPMSKPVFMEFWRGLKGLPRSEAKSPRKTIQRGQAWIPVKDALQASVNATPTHEKGVATMATKTKTPTRKGQLKSAFLFDDPDVAYVAYKKMPHTKSPNARVMSKREFVKVFPERHAAALAKEQARNASVPAKRSSTKATTTTQGTIDTVLGEQWESADQAVIDALIKAGYTMPEVEVEDEDEPDTDAPDPTIISALAHNTEALNAYLAQFGGSATTTTKAQRSNAKRYRARTDRTELPGEGNAYAEDDDVAPASNAVLWALNTEGLLAQAYERAEEAGDVLGTDNAEDTPYITQAIGKGLLTEVFGPLPERTTTA